MVIKKKIENRKQKIKQKQNWKQTKTEIKTENLIETKTNGNDQARMYRVFFFE